MTSSRLYKFLENKQRIIDSGIPHKLYACPNEECGNELVSTLPDPGDVIHTIAWCPYCDHGFYKVVYPDGYIQTFTPEQYNRSRRQA